MQISYISRAKSSGVPRSPWTRGTPYVPCRSVQTENAWLLIERVWVEFSSILLLSSLVVVCMQDRWLVTELHRPLLYFRQALS